MSGNNNNRVNKKKKKSAAKVRAPSPSPPREPEKPQPRVNQLASPSSHVFGPKPTPREMVHEWTKIVRKKGRRVRDSPIRITRGCEHINETKWEPPAETVTDSLPIDVEAQQIVRKMEVAKFRFEETSKKGYYYGFTKQLLEAFKRIGANFTTCKPKQIICYGLGSFSTSLNARYQLAFLSKIKEMLKIRVEVFDPIFTAAETYALKSILDMTVLEKNEEGKRVVDGLTLFYLPHCSHQLVNNLLHANWSPDLIKKCIIISNSFESICQNGVPRQQEQSFQLISKSTKVGIELSLENDFEFRDIFNDSAIHVFPEANVNKMTEYFWNVDDPLYDHVDYVSNTNSNRNCK